MKYIEKDKLPLLQCTEKKENQNIVAKDTFQNKTTKNIQKKKEELPKKILSIKKNLSGEEKESSSAKKKGGSLPQFDEKKKQYRKKKENKKNELEQWNDKGQEKKETIRKKKSPDPQKLEKIARMVRSYKKLYKGFSKNYSRIFKKKWFFFQKKAQKKLFRKPLLTFSDSSETRDFLSNWNRYRTYPKNYFGMALQYEDLFRQNRKMYEQYTRFKDVCLGSIPFCGDFVEKKDYTPRLLPKKPDILILLNSNREYGVVYGGSRQTIPLYGFVDTYTKKDPLDIRWSGNGADIHSIREWCRWMYRLYQYVECRRFKKTDWLGMGRAVESNKKKGV